MPSDWRKYASTCGRSCETRIYSCNDSSSRYRVNFSPRSLRSLLCEMTSTTIRGFITDRFFRSRGSNSGLPQMTNRSGYMYRGVRGIPTRRLLSSTRQGFPLSLIPSSRPLFSLIKLWLYVPPAIDTISPSTYSSFSSESSAIRRYSSMVSPRRLFCRHRHAMKYTMWPNSVRSFSASRKEPGHVSHFPSRPIHVDRIPSRLPAITGRSPRRPRRGRVAVWRINKPASSPTPSPQSIGRMKSSRII